MSARTFELLHPVGLLVSARLSESDLLVTFPAVGSTKRDMQTGWTWYSLPDFTDGGVVVSVSLGFRDGHLAVLELFDANKKYGRTWDDWSEEKERSRAQSIGGWLARRGFQQGKYEWGDVWFGFDPKGGSGSAGVRYV